MDTKEATEGNDTVKATRRDDVRVVVAAVGAALDMHERITMQRIARSRQMLRELSAWAQSGCGSPIAERYVELLRDVRERSNEDDAGEVINREFWETAAFSTAIETCLCWIASEDEPGACASNPAEALKLLLEDIESTYQLTSFRDEKACRDAAIEALRPANDNSEKEQLGA